MVRGVIRHIGSRGGGAPIVWRLIAAPAPDEPPLHPYRWGSPYNLTRFCARFPTGGRGDAGDVGACLHSTLRYADASHCSVRQDVCRCWWLGLCHHVRVRAATMSQESAKPL